jgi:hypothetical protein
MHSTCRNFPTFPPIGVTPLPHAAGTAATQEPRPSSRARPVARRPTRSRPHKPRGCPGPAGGSTGSRTTSRRERTRIRTAGSRQRRDTRAPSYGNGERADQSTAQRQERDRKLHLPGKGSYLTLPTRPRRRPMSFRSREKKRRAKIAVGKARAQHHDTMAGRHYLTIVSRPCCCNECGGSLREGRECVYRHTPREILCAMCACAKASLSAVGALGEVAAMARTMPIGSELAAVLPAIPQAREEPLTGHPLAAPFTGGPWRCQ